VLQIMIQNLRYAWRQLRHAPELNLLAVVTLALGIGANTAMFTVVQSVLLRPLPYLDANTLLQICSSAADSGGLLSWLDYRDIRDDTGILNGVAAYSNDVGVIQSNDASVSVVTTEVTPNLFELLGVRPLRGRTFNEEEGQTNGPPAVLLSEDLWRNTFGADPALVGKRVRVNGQERTVAGVMPKDFRFPESGGQDVAKGVWLPIQPTREMLHDRGYRFFTILARPIPGATVPQVQSKLRWISARIRAADSKADRTLEFRAVPYLEIVTGPVRAVFLALAAALALVLLIACANVANLLIARCLMRQHEFAVRAALGSGIRRLAGQIVVEAGLLSVLGCALGFFVAYWMLAAIHSLPPGIVPRAEAIQLRWSVVVTLGLIATVSTILSALLPALFIIRTKPQAALLGAARSVGTKSAGMRAGGWLVAGEVALSALLLIATGLLFRTLWSLEHVRLGFETESVTSFAAMPADAAGFGNMTVGAAAGMPASVANTVYQPLLEALRHSPGVNNAALITAPPFSGIDMQAGFRVLGGPPTAGNGLQARLLVESGGYERLMGTPVLRGRGLAEQDNASAPFVAAINEALARKYFAGKEALGQQLDFGGRETGMLRPYTIVGIVADQVEKSASQPVQPLVMLPYQQIPPASLFYPGLLKTMVYFVVKTRGNIAVAPAVRMLFHRIAPDLALNNFQTMQEAVDQSNAGTRLGLDLIAAFAGLAVLMVIAGLYGVLAQVVSQRRREFGVRMALGASRQSIVRMVLLQALAIVAAGLAAGIVLALSMGELVKSFLYGVKPLDASTYVFVAVALVIVGILAALLPSWRAASSEPMKALRET
jgi:putative ABC transport system permease protein